MSLEHSYARGVLPDARAAARALYGLAFRLLAVGSVGLLLFAFAGGGVTYMEGEYDKAVIGLFHAQQVSRTGVAPQPRDAPPDAAGGSGGRAAEWTYATPLTFTGACDGSAAVALDRVRILSATDDDDTLRVYDALRGGPPLARVDADGVLGPTQPGKESDLEGVATLGDTVVWITSHGPNPEGKPRPNRYRLAAAALGRAGDAPPIGAPVGSHYDSLLADMAREPALAPLVAGRARPPESAGAVNIEAVAPGAGGTLLIGFRNPVPNGRAQIVPLRNPLDVMRGRAPRFGPPIGLALGGRGLRDLAYWPERRTYVLVAGPPGPTGTFGLYLWDGTAAGRAKPIRGLTWPAEFRPEGVVVVAGERERVLLLSDDGDRRDAGGRVCKELDGPARSFRGAWLTVPR